MLSRNQFCLLEQFADNNSNPQRLDNDSKLLEELTQLGFIDANNKITETGLKTLEPYCAKRAIFMAAGFGSRMVPVTLDTPKPLVKVNGVRIIDRLIDALYKAGINEIVIVRGYLKEKFDILKDKYPNIKFVDNDNYNGSNNIYSIYLVRDLLCNSYIFEADLVLSNPDIISKYHYQSDFLAIPVEKSDDWCFDTNGNFITDFKKGGKNCYQEVGISYWDKEDGQKLEKHIKKAYEMPNGKDLLWENVPLVVFNKEYKVEIKECKQEDVVEIDSFKELCQLDSSYVNHRKYEIEIDKHIINNICNVLKCDTTDIKNIKFMKIGLTNMSFKFNVYGTNYVYRNPGENTKKFINRKSEIYSENVAKELNLDNSLIWIDESGWKLSKYIENSAHINPYNKQDQLKSINLIKKLHNANIISEYDFDYIFETQRFIDMFIFDKSVDFDKYQEINQRMIQISNKLNQLGYKKTLCHNDFWFYNILEDDKGNLTLIDWEYSGNAYPASDVAYFTSSLNITNDDYLELAKLYENHNLNDKEIFYYESVMAIVMWYWFVWALYKEANGKIIDDKQMWFEKAVNALEYAEGMNYLEVNVNQ